MSFTNEEVRDAAREADLEAGYDKPVEKYEAVLGILDPAAVAKDLKSRAKVAMEREALMSRAYPLLDPPAQIADDDPDRELKILVYKYLDKNLWQTTAPLTGQIQKLLETRSNGNGHVLCRLGGLRGNAAYLTGDPECFRVDVIESRSANDVNSVTKLAQFYGRTGKRLPHMEQIIADAFDESLRGVLAAGRAQLPLLQQKYTKKDK